VETIGLEIARQITPYYLYQRLHLIHYREYFNYKVENGGGYMLRRLTVKYPSVDARGTTYNPQIEIEHFDNAVNKARQINPIPARLYAPPAGHEDIAVIAAPSPVDNTAFGVNMTSSQRLNHKILNYYFPYGDTILVHITGQDTTNPSYVDLLFEGYFMPVKAGKI